MSVSEWQRLTRDLEEQPGLRQSLGAALAHCPDREQAAALLRRHGYAIEPADLPAAPPAAPPAPGAALPDAAL
ncbi:Nif11 family protein, partial [Teichococcus cervicalis]